MGADYARRLAAAREALDYFEDNLPDLDDEAFAALLKLEIFAHFAPEPDVAIERSDHD